MIKKCLFHVLSILFSTSIYAQNIDSDKLDAYFSALAQNNKFMGSVAVSKDGQLIYSRSVGFADLESNSKADENAKYRIGSISKTFTAVLVMKAFEEKKIDLDKSIDTYFPTLPNADKITIKQLLSHRSGIPNFTDDASYMSWYTQPKTEQEMMQIISNAGSDFAPGSKAEYSNSNYVILTYILEKAYGKNFAQLLEEYITKPLNLQNTYLGRQIDPTKKESKSYKYVDSWQPQQETDISIPLGAGGIVSTPIDLVHFNEALFNGKLITPQSLAMMTTINDNFGLGLFKIPFYDKIGFGHTGGIDAFSSTNSYFPDSKISFALTSNGSNYNNNNIAIAVLSAVYDKPFEVPIFSNYTVSSSELDQYVGLYSSKDIPLKITISKDNTTLIAQATGQPSFPLEATAKNIFKFEQAGVVLNFNPAEKTMILKQGAGEFLFTAEEKH